MEIKISQDTFTVGEKIYQIPKYVQDPSKRSINIDFSENEKIEVNNYVFKEALINS